METIKNAIPTLTLALLVMFALSSCSESDEALVDCRACDVMERTDIEISGELDIRNFEESIEADATNDLVRFNYFGNPSIDFDYKIQLSNGYELIIRVHDAANTNPWQQINLPYNIYPQSELDDKLMYTTVELRTAANEPLFSSNLNSTTPPGTFLDVFKVVQYDGSQLQARIRDMVLYKFNNPEKEIRINGTFIGAVTFE